MSTNNLSNLIAAGADLLDEAQAAELLTVAKGTLGVWRSTGRYALPFINPFFDTPYAYFLLFGPSLTISYGFF